MGLWRSGLSRRQPRRAARRRSHATGATSHRPFSPSALSDRADDAWRAARLERVTLHDLRHTYASFAIAVGVNVKALSEYMGHASIVMTMDRYGHLLPGNEAEAAGLLDAYLTRETKGA